MTRYLLGLATGIAIGVYIGQRLVWAEEPETEEPMADALEYEWRDRMLIVTERLGPDEYGASSVVATNVATWFGCWAEATWGNPVPESDDWATDPHLTTLTEGGNPR